MSPVARLVAFTLAVALVGGDPAIVFAQSGPRQTSGTIEGTATGPTGPLSRANVQLLDAQGKIIDKTITNVTGSFRFSELRPGRYVVQILGPNGGVAATATVTINAGAMTATVALSATAAALAGAAGAATVVPVVLGAGVSGVSAASILGAVMATVAATGATFAALRQVNADASPSR